MKRRFAVFAVPLREGTVSALGHFVIVYFAVFYIKVLCLLLGTPNSKRGTLILKTTSGVYY